jgi:hypothetical protein
VHVPPERGFGDRHVRGRDLHIGEVVIWLKGVLGEEKNQKPTGGETTSPAEGLTLCVHPLCADHLGAEARRYYMSFSQQPSSLGFLSFLPNGGSKASSIQVTSLNVASRQQIWNLNPSIQLQELSLSHDPVLTLLGKSFYLHPNPGQELVNLTECG